MWKGLSLINKIIKYILLTYGITIETTKLCAGVFPTFFTTKTEESSSPKSAIFEIDDGFLVSALYGEYLLGINSGWVLDKISNSFWNFNSPKL